MSIDKKQVTTTQDDTLYEPWLESDPCMDYYPYEEEEDTAQSGGIPNWAWQQLRDAGIYKDSPEFRQDILQSAKSYADIYKETFEGGMSWAIDEIIMFESDSFDPDYLENRELFEDTSQNRAAIRKPRFVDKSPSKIRRRRRTKDSRARWQISCRKSEL